MIIIDDMKYNELRRTFLRHRVTLGNYPLETGVAPLRHMFISQIKEKFNLVIRPEQVDFTVEDSKGEGPIDLTFFFKVNRRNVALMVDLDEVLGIPLNFSPPIKVVTSPNLANLSSYTPGVPEAIPYNSDSYYPWGYDLERDCQVWRRR